MAKYLVNLFKKLFCRNKHTIRYNDIVIFALASWREFAVVRILGHDEFENKTHYIILEYYGEIYKEQYHTHYKGAACNDLFFKTFYDLMMLEHRILYPDIILSALLDEKIAMAIKRYPFLKGPHNIVNQIEYDTVWMDGYPVIVIKDPMLHLWYWSIEELETRSTDKTEGIDRGINGTGRFKTEQQATDSARKFLDYLFHASVA